MCPRPVGVVVAKMKEMSGQYIYHAVYRKPVAPVIQW